MNGLGDYGVRYHGLFTISKILVYAFACCLSEKVQRSWSVDCERIIIRCNQYFLLDILDGFVGADIDCDGSRVIFVHFSLFLINRCEAYRH